MGNIGEDPNEYLPRDYRQDALQSNTKNPPNNNLNDVPYNHHNNSGGDAHYSNNYGNQGYDGNGGDMNGPTSVAMYERQSPNPAMGHHTVSSWHRIRLYEAVKYRRQLL